MGSLETMYLGVRVVEWRGPNEVLTRLSSSASLGHPYRAVERVPTVTNGRVGMVYGPVLGVIEPGGC